MNAQCLLYGGLISVLVTILKGKVGFIRNNPKWISLFASMLIAGASSWYHGALPTAAQLTACVLTQLAGSVASHEIAIKPVMDSFASTASH